MSKTSRTPYKKRITKKRRASDAERERKKRNRYRLTQDVLENEAVKRV